MSEYQYYEWQTVDRLLTETEQEGVNRLSSHIEVSASRAVVTYSWGDFKHDPRQVLARFFDAHLYLANWGSRRLAFRFPAGLVSRDAINAYCVRDRITFKTISGFDILDMDLSEEEGGGWIEPEGSLSGLIPLRNDILKGDYRSVYLAWLKAMSLTGGDAPRGRKPNAASDLSPAVPPGLQQLSPALKRFLEQFDVPPCLVQAAAETSPKLAETPEIDYRPLVAQFSREECDDLLCRLAQGDTTAGMELRKRLLALMPPAAAAPEVRLSANELLKRAESIETARRRRQKEEARRKHEAEMKTLAEREPETWRQVASLVDLKQTKGYDEAVQLLAKLAQLAEFRGSEDNYRRQVNDLCDRYKRLTGFKWRVHRAKLLDDQPNGPFDQDGQ